MVLYGFTKLLPGQSFGLYNSACCSSFRLLALVSCLRSPTSQLGSVGLLLQPNDIPYIWCPRLALGVTTKTSTRDFETPALNSIRNNRAGEIPLGFGVPSPPQYLFKAPLPHGGELSQTFLANPHSLSSLSGLSPASKYNSLPGCNQLTLLALLLPNCQRYEWIWICIWNPEAMFTDEHPYVRTLWLSTLPLS